MSLYWEFENGNKFSKSKFSFKEAEAYSRTLVNCKDCVNCSWCLDRQSRKDEHNPSWR